MPEKYFKKFSRKSLLNDTYFLLFIIAVFGLALRLIFFTGMGISDSLVYSQAANDIGTLNADTLSTRLGLVLATSIFYDIFGINDLSAVLFVLLTSISTIILIFYFGRLLFNEKIGLMSAFLLSFFPLDIVYSTQLLSDIPSAFFMALGVYIFLYAELKQKLQYGLSYLLSGIFIGIGYMIRESILLIALFFISYVIYKRRIKKEYFFVPLGVIIIFVAESLIFLGLTGNFLFRTEASQSFLLEAMQQHNFFGRLQFPTGLFHYPWLFLTNSLLLYFYLFIFIAGVYVVITKKKESLILLLWFIPIILYLSFGSASFTQYLPFRAVDRYTSIITIPAILLLSIFLLEKNKLMKKVMMPVTLLLLFTTSISSVYLHDNRTSLDNLREIYPTLTGIDKNIYIDSRSLMVLEFIDQYNGNLNLKKYPENLLGIKDSYITINNYMIKNLKEANPKLTFPKEIENPPNNWHLIKQKNQIEIYYTK